jgi:hypothetical protein
MLSLGPAAVSRADSPPSVRTLPVTNVADATARFNGVVDPEGRTSRVWFEYGTTPNYGSTSSFFDFDGDNDIAVLHPSIGLTPGTTYYVRLRARNTKGETVGNGVTFTTTGTAPAAPAPPTTTPLTPATPPAPAREPQIGSSVVVAPSAGTVLVKTGNGSFQPLAAGDDIPVGSLVDTRKGTVVLTTAVAGGQTQTAEFRGALFQVRQAPNAGGLTDIVLRGDELSSCTSRRTARSAASRRRPAVRRLWSSDSNGKFRTHGRNSVATVRGTTWITTETCAGTRTTVTEGAVSVRDLRRKKSVLVRAGSSYLARAAR